MLSDNTSAPLIAPSSLLTRIKHRLQEMTKSERTIGEYLVKRPLDAAFLPASRLSELAGVSESSVLRFSRALGYSSYQELQLEIQEEIRRRLTRNASERLREAVARVTSEGEILTAALETDVRNLEVTQQQIDPEEFQVFIEHLSNAKRVFVVGMRGAASPAGLLGYSLNLLRPEVRVLVHQADMVADQLADIRAEDVLVGLAFSRQSIHTILAVEAARRASAPVLAITDDPLGPIATRANHSLFVAMDSQAFIQSYTSVVALTHAILSALGKHRQETALERLTEIEEALGEQHVFYPEEK